MVAYRQHMKHIQNELNLLKSELEDKAQKMKRDSQVKDLRYQVGWFKKEALTLKNEMERQEEREVEVKLYNLSLNEQNLALE